MTKWLILFNRAMIDGLDYENFYSVLENKEHGSRLAEGSLLSYSNNQEIIL